MPFPLQEKFPLGNVVARLLGGCENCHITTGFILTLPAARTGRKIRRRRTFTPPPQPDTPAASVRDLLAAADTRVGRPQ